MRRVVYPHCDFTYEAAHWLPHVPEGHQCRRMHGHSYHLTVTLRGPVQDNGFVIDFADIKSYGHHLVHALDHRVLNDIEGLENPTVENQLIWFWECLEAVMPGLLYELTLRETPTNSATYRGEAC